VRTLGFAADTEHVEAVESMLDDPDGEVRRHTCRALERLRKRLDLIQ